MFCALCSPMFREFTQIPGWPHLPYFCKKRKVMEFLHYFWLILFNSKSPQFLRIPAARWVSFGCTNYTKPRKILMESKFWGIPAGNNLNHSNFNLDLSQSQSFNPVPHYLSSQHSRQWAGDGYSGDGQRGVHGGSECHDCAGEGGEWDPTERLQHTGSSRGEQLWSPAPSPPETKASQLHVPGHDEARRTTQSSITVSLAAEALRCFSCTLRSLSSPLH